MWVRQELYKHCLCKCIYDILNGFSGKSWWISQNLTWMFKIGLYGNIYNVFFPIKKNPLIISHLYFPCLSSDWAGWGCGHGNSAARRSWSCWASWHWPCPWGTCPPGGSRYTTRMAVPDLGGNGTLLAQLFQFVSNEARLLGLKSWNFQRSHLPAIQHAQKKHTKKVHNLTSHRGSC